MKFEITKMEHPPLWWVKLIDPDTGEFVAYMLNEAASTQTVAVVPFSSYKAAEAAARKAGHTPA